MTAEPQRAQRGYLIVAATLLAGTIAGVLIMLLASLVSTAGPSGDGWSFRGNGALIVPFGIAPAVLASGWTMLILHRRSHSRWILLGIVAGLLELAILAVSVVALVAGGSQTGASVSLFAQPLQLVIMVGSPVLAIVLPAPTHRRIRPSWWHLLAGVMLPLALIIGLVIGGFFGA